MKNTTIRASVRLAASVLLVTASINNVYATFVASVGPGTSIANDSVDSAPPGLGGRTNVALSHTLLLPAGTYTATSFHYDAGQAGDVRPFLASSNGLHSYLVLALGDLQNIVGVSTDQTVGFGGSDTFTLGAATTVYAGISSLDVNPIFLDDAIFGTDHDSVGLDPVFLGATIAGFNIPNLTRQYAFSIDVVPEPGSIVLAGLGSGVLLVAAWRRRRHAS